KKLRDLLKAHGSFKALEVSILKSNKSTKMISAAWTWAANTKNLRRNPIHGEEEAKLVLDDKFEAADITAQEMQMRGEIDVEDDSGFLLEPDIPSIDAAPASIVDGSAGSSSGAQAVLGRKIDNCEDVLEKLAKVGGARAMASVKSGTGSVVSKADKEEKKGGKKEKKEKKPKKTKKDNGDAKGPKGSPKAKASRKKTGGSSENDEQDDDDDLGDELFVGFEAGDDQQGEAKETGCGVPDTSAFILDYNEEMASLSVPVLAHGDEGR
ncbi:Khdc3, partial [Symbiodinium microadriaticum]